MSTGSLLSFRLTDSLLPYSAATNLLEFRFIKNPVLF